MRTSLDHLPKSKQKDIAYIADVLKDEVDQATGFSNGKKRHSKILKIILFGSHSSDKWVNDYASGYLSDYDLLIILNRSELQHDYKIWHTAEERIGINVKPPLNILVHTLQEVNQYLQEGHYFFSDIQQEGIAVYESEFVELVQANNLTDQQAKAIAQKHFKQWFESANRFFINFEDNNKKNWFKEAAFLLHQATERYYACLLLVLTNYKPNTHNLRQLNSFAIQQNPKLAEVFPQDTKIHRRNFELLKKAYVDARYSEHYKITIEELDWLSTRVKRLQELTNELCQEKINH